MNQNEKLSIYEKLIDIQSKLNVPKSKHNSFAEFNYRSCEDILKAAKPLLKENGVLLLLTDKAICVGDKHYIEATAILTDGVNKIETTAYAREPETPKPKMDASQTTGSTSSYARKYALNGLFDLDDNDDSDATNNKPQKLITKKQIDELKGLGFDDARLLSMANYYKAKTIEEVTFEQAAEAIKKQKRAIEKSAKASAEVKDGQA